MSKAHSTSVIGRLLGCLVLALAVMCACGSAWAFASSAPGWEVTAGTYPSTIKPGSSARIVLAIYNVGGAASSGAVTVTDTLPEGLVATEAGFFGTNILTKTSGDLWNCSLGTTVSCVNNPTKLATIPPGEIYYLEIVVTAAANVAGTAVNEMTVSGGGAIAPSARATNPIAFGSTAPSFGFQNFDSWSSNMDGSIDTQAGSHPNSLTVAYFLNDEIRPVGESRDVIVNAPPGVVGNPLVTPRCTRAQLNAQLCPADTQIGIEEPILGGPEAMGTPIASGGGRLLGLRFPLYNMVPPPGEPAQFGFSFVGVGARLNAHVRDKSDYKIYEEIINIPQRQVTFNSVTLWGSPGDPSHDFERCSRHAEKELTVCGLSAGVGHEPLLTQATSCPGPVPYSGFTDSWMLPGTPGSGVSEIEIDTHDASDAPQGMTGCDRLSFKPSVEISPDTSSADSPAGLTADVKMPQAGLSNVDSLAMADIKNTKVTLPQGVVINPGQATGLVACSSAQSAVGTEDAPSCPSASQVGTDEITTPLLPDKLTGNVYILGQNPPNLQLLVAAAGDGVNLKLIGDVHLDEATGQLTTRFTETPQLPFTDFKLSFSGGARAALATPTRCGTYESQADFTPWSSPGGQDVFDSSKLQITSGPGGSPCQATLPFAPSMTAGATTDQAGGYTNFSMLLTREDGQQRIERLQFKTPEGLLGMISQVTLCEEPAASKGECPADSQIGHTVVTAGPGPYPFEVPQAGAPAAPIYLTGSYDGAPYGLSIVVPVIAGPFNLGTVVVRAKIEVDPHTSRLTITTDPLPMILDGIPTDLRAIDAVIDRANFMFNPTDCQPMSFSGTAFSNEGATAPIGSHFQVGSCQTLKFKPGFSVTTSAKTSRADGASLIAKVTYPPISRTGGQATSQASIAAVKVDLPKRLPSRLTTLQKACPIATFEANPATCSPASIVGHAKATTPLLLKPLEGPAYFVSHGGQKFPELIVVLQGDGVTVQLNSETFINDAGITSSTFRQVPDVPVSTFELTLPEGPHSALAANGNLCQASLLMPTSFVGQNGATLKQNTRIEARGCPNTIVVIRHRVHKRTVALTVAVPAAGTLTANGKGLAQARKTSAGRGTVTLELKQRHPGKLTTRVKLRFTPGTGKQRHIQSKTLNITIAQ